MRDHLHNVNSGRLRNEDVKPGDLSFWYQAYKYHPEETAWFNRKAVLYQTDRFRRELTGLPGPQILHGKLLPLPRRKCKLVLCFYSAYILFKLINILFFFFWLFKRCRLNLSCTAWNANSIRSEERCRGFYWFRSNIWSNKNSTDTFTGIQSASPVVSRSLGKAYPEPRISWLKNSISLLKMKDSTTTKKLSASSSYSWIWRTGIISSKLKPGSVRCMVRDWVIKKK